MRGYDRVGMLTGLVVLLSAGAPAMAGGKFGKEVATRLEGCRGELRTHVARVRVRHTIDTMADIRFETPIGTWVEENGPVRHAEPGKTAHVRDAKYALLEGDRVEIRMVQSSRHSTLLSLALAGGESVLAAKLELRFAGSLRKDFADIDRLWRTLGRVVVLESDPDDPAHCPGSVDTEPPA